ncbi:MAG TPA: glutamine--tRNA ligase/YqeY domain fusion protein [Verrucomicrobiae bacterium]|nr:glutamine--tRNA ligase/YqeY domain fusion protein [Verrucomicrobiae bacterium]
MLDMSNEPTVQPSDFIRDIVKADFESGKHKKIVTRFPPEPNGYLHIGHAKSICLNFGIAREFNGQCNLRMDDTNPTKEDVEYVDSITEDVNWLIAGWADHCLGLKPKGKTPETITSNGKPDFYLPATVGRASRPSASENMDSRDARPTLLEAFYASDYFDQIYAYAIELIQKGKAYVCDLSPEDTDAYRGAPDKPGKESPFRNRTVKESLDLFVRMKNGEFPDGARTLKAKIDMASPNIWMRDPVLYRIRHSEHHHTGNKWCIYPMYDFAHCLSDYIEGITHSICTLEFEVHRPLYDWILENLDLPRPLPHQFEFARLSVGYTIMSKRKLMQLVKDGIVHGWDDPRMPTISGLRRRGVTAEALRTFAYNIGITKYNSLTDVAVLEHSIREDLNKRALRRLAVLRPLKLVITNLPGNHYEELDAVNNPEDPSAGARKIPFGPELWIEQDDFMETPPPKFFRLKPGGEVRLKYAYIIKCDEVIKDATGKVTELRCTADLGSKTGGPTSSRKIKGTIHWVSAAHAIDAEVRLYDRLFTVPEPDATGDFKSAINPHSLEVVTAKCESNLVDARPDLRYQFERLGYFSLDTDSDIQAPVPSQRKLVFNRTITLKDTWAKIEQKGK